MKPKLNYFYYLLNGAFFLASLLIESPIFAAQAEAPKEYAFRVARSEECIEKEFNCKKATTENSEPLEQNKLRKEIIRHICLGGKLPTLFISATIDPEVAALWANFLYDIYAFPLTDKIEGTPHSFYRCDSRNNMAKLGITGKNSAENKAIEFAERSREILFPFRMQAIGIIPKKIFIISCIQSFPNGRNFSYNLNACKNTAPLFGSSCAFATTQIGACRKIIYTGCPSSPDKKRFFNLREINTQVVKNEVACKIASMLGLFVPRHSSYVIRVAHDFSLFSNTIETIEGDVRIMLFDFDLKNWLNKDSIDLVNPKISILFFAYFIIIGEKAFKEIFDLNKENTNTWFFKCTNGEISFINFFDAFGSLQFNEKKWHWSNEESLNALNAFINKYPQEPSFFEEACRLLQKEKEIEIISELNRLVEDMINANPEPDNLQHWISLPKKYSDRMKSLREYFLVLLLYRSLI